jgi:hypothetical protein
MDIHFCDLCNESVPQSDLDIGRAFIRRGRVVCAKCEGAMTHTEGSGSHAQRPSGVVALEAEIETALGALTEESFLAPDPELHVLSEPLLGGESGSHARAAYPGSPGIDPGPLSSTASVATPAASGAPRSSGLVLAMVALIFAAGAAAVLNEQIGGIGTRASALESAAHSQEAALRELQKSSAQTRDAIAALEARIGEGLSSQREIAEKSLVDLKAQNEIVAKAGVDLGQKIDELREASQTRGAELDRKNDELSHRLAKGEDDNRAILDRLAKLEDVASHPPIPTATAAAPTASRWSTLVADLQSPKAATRWQAVDQIGQAADPEAVPYLLPMLKDTDVFVRMATARVLGDLKATTAVPPLIDALEDVEPAVREAALGSLRALTGKDLRFDPMASESDRAKKVKAWRDWWKKVEDEGGLGKSQG